MNDSSIHLTSGKEVLEIDNLEDPLGLLEYVPQLVSVAIVSSELLRQFADHFNRLLLGTRG